ncbi:MAG TPA: hypothetical protein ENK04_03480 [Gammaproteobacteria bacterium]|nr:hypothetical protein [Gammaproteobacteria bacterium]
MADFFNSFEDGWTIYLWLVAGAAIVLTAIYWVRWAAHNDQFDEDIKYVVFDENDKDKMAPEEFEKAMKVNKAQEELRKEYLEKEAERKQRTS